MTLSVNLIEEGEKRHGGSLTTLFLMRSLAIALPVILILFLSHLLITLRMDRASLARTTERILDKQSQTNDFAKVKAQQKLYLQMKAQLDGFAAIRLDCSRQLTLIQETVPLEVQVTSLHLDRNVSISNNVPTIVYKLALSGKTGGQPEANLTRFQTQLKGPSLTNTLATVDVPEGAFVEDKSPGALPRDRLFQLNCAFLPRGFK